MVGGQGPGDANGAAGRFGRHVRTRRVPAGRSRRRMPAAGHVGRASPARRGRRRRGGVERHSAGRPAGRVPKARLRGNMAAPWRRSRAGDFGHGNQHGAGVSLSHAGLALGGDPGLCGALPGRAGRRRLAAAAVRRLRRVPLALPADAAMGDRRCGHAGRVQRLPAEPKPGDADHGTRRCRLDVDPHARLGAGGNVFGSARTRPSCRCAD